MTTPALSADVAADAEELIVAWMQPLRRSGTARQTGDPLPFTLVTQITGTEDIDLEIADPVVSVHTLCSKTLGDGAAKTESQTTHRRMIELGRYRDDIIINGGQVINVDYVAVFQQQIWVTYEDTQILRKVGRYIIGLSYVPVPSP